MLNRLNIPLRILSELELSSKEYGLNTPQRIAHFVSQARHESQGIYKTVEILTTRQKDYLMFSETLRGSVNGKGLRTAAEPIANRFTRTGMVMEMKQAGDGWKYRGRGISMLTDITTIASGIYPGEDFIIILICYKQKNGQLRQHYGIKVKKRIE